MNTAIHDSIFPIFVYTGNPDASNQIQAYCQRWYERAGGQQTFINVVYLADVMPVFAVPNMRVYRVKRTESGYELELMVDLIDSWIGSKDISDFLPWDSIYDEAYYWDWIDDISLKPTVARSSVQPIPEGNPGTIPIVTPSGIVPTSIRDVIPAGLNPGGKVLSMPYGWTLPEGYSFAGISNHLQQWTCDDTQFWYADFQNLAVERQSNYYGVGSVVGGDFFARISTAEPYFQRGFQPHPSYGGGMRGVFCLKTENTDTLKNPTQDSFYINNAANFVLDSLNSSYSFVTFTLFSEVLHAPSTKTGYYYKRPGYYAPYLERVEFEPMSPPLFQFQQLDFHFMRCEKSVSELLPWLPPLELQTDALPHLPILPFTPGLPPFVLGGTMMQSMNMIANLIIQQAGATRKKEDKKRE